MKKFIAGLAVALILAVGTACHKPRTTHHERLTPERAATHSIIYYKSPGKDVGQCTGTAIGPHAILTGAHCNEGEELVKHISLDYSTRYYTILEIITDEQDHDIYILDGPAFTNFVQVHAREAKIGEHVVSYGTGGKSYPPHTYDGYAEHDIVSEDQSDVDAAEGAHAFSLPVVPGDSGSAVYANDGSLVALVTWGNDRVDPETLEITGEAVGSALNFPQQLLEKISTLRETENNDDHRSNAQH